MVKILLGHRPDAARLAALQAAHPSVEFLTPDEPADLIRLIADADAFFGALRPEVYQAARKLRWVQSPSAGVEWIWQVPAIVDSPVVVTNARGAHATTIAEHTFALLLYFTRALRVFDRYQQESSWERSAGYSHVEGLAGKTMGIVGLGRIGTAIAKRASAFEMTVIAVDAHPVAHGPEVAELRGLDGLHDMLRRTDVLVISAPITPETRGMIGATELALLRPGSYIVAVSRGGIIDQDALVAALREDRFAGVGLDVTDPEPLPSDNPLWGFEKVLITPHISGGSKLTTENMWAIFSENIGRFTRGEDLTNVVDKKLGY